jgi:UDP-N-acetylglucosamine--N-acetylmuramyl-(pentapeptide) pyrophosphoryl-undecaprenol N-acetylglucosamine transferase
MTHDSSYSNQYSKKLLIAGGGTGGHIFAGTSIGLEWKKQGGEVLFVGSKGSLEEVLVPKSGIPLKCIQIGSLKGGSVFKKIKSSLKIPYSMVQSAVIVLKYRPQMVIGVGGFASGPVVLTARLLQFFWGGATVSILEQNSIPGFTNRILSYVSNKIFTAFQGVETAFPACVRSKVIFVGNPIRSIFKPLESSIKSPNQNSDPNSKTHLFIFGGSQGAVGLNTLILKLLKILPEDLKQQFVFTHQTGEQDYTRVTEGYLSLGYQAHEQFRTLKFIDDMLSEYQKAHIVICRSGSSTLSELAAVGRAAILVPLPTAADQHQLKNAKFFEIHQSALCCEQNQPDAEIKLLEMMKDLLKDPSKIQTIENNIKKYYQPNTAQMILEQIQ